MSYAVQGFTQIAPPLVDTSMALLQSPTAVFGNSPNFHNLNPPIGQVSGASDWIQTSGGAFTTDTIGGGGVEYIVTTTPGTFNGLGPVYGWTSRLIAPPAGTLVLPYGIDTQMMRFEVFGMSWASAPSGTQCGQDSGVAWTVGGAANGAVFDTAQVGNGGQSEGFGVVYSVTAGALLFVAKNISGTGHALSVSVNIGNPANGITNPFYLDMRITGPQVSGGTVSAASIQVFIDKTQITTLTAAQSSWGAGTLLPVPPWGVSNQIGLLPAIVNNTQTATTANPLLRFQGARLRIGSVAACTLENQF